jgi:hypothetical protein
MRTDLLSRLAGAVIAFLAFAFRRIAILLASSQVAVKKTLNRKKAEKENGKKESARM